MKPIIDEITKDQLISGRDQFKVGDGVRVHTRVREGEKERIQIFAGIGEFPTVKVWKDCFLQTHLILKKLKSSVKA